MLEVKTISISIERDWREVYEAVWRPEFFPKWASGLANSSFGKSAGRWTAEGPGGPVSIRFTDHNDFGVMDHYVELDNGDEIYVPLRVFANEAGAEISLTLFRQPGMSTATFDADADWVRKDLTALKKLVTTGTSKK
jgi:hypothetical protein